LNLRGKKKKFIVYGSYYNIKLDSDNIIKCRNCLEIFDKNLYTNLDDAINPFDEISDAIAIMMNPGSSRPLLEDYSEPCYDINGIEKNIIANKMVLAKPDTTQYQIMRIMDYISWRNVRVLNLSDIREPKCNEFFKKVKDFERNYDNCHSVFYENRIEERKLAFKTKNYFSPIIVAWGCNRSLCNLANRAIVNIDKRRIVGILHNVDNLYRHPLPTLYKAKKEWLEQLTNKLKNQILKYRDNI
jgi:hypothetical protein